MTEGYKKKVFISYSHKDELWKNRLKTHLNVCVKQNKIEVWDDNDIQIGQKWNIEIKESIVDSDIIILLISSNFLSSDFIMDEEIPFILEHQKNSNFSILPLMLSPCNWEEFDWLKYIQGYPKDYKPLSGKTDYEIDSDLTNFTKVICSSQNLSIDINKRAIQELENIFERYFQNNLDEIKKSILRYYSNESVNFQNILNANDINRLSEILLKEQECIYCLFKELNIKYQYLDTKKFENIDCNNLKESVLKNRKINQVVLKINIDSNNKIDDCEINGWFRYITNEYRAMSVLKNINFSNDSYQNKLSKYLSDELKGMIYNKPLELQLILPLKLFHINFKKLKIGLQDKFGNRYFEERPWERYFNISTRFLMRIDNYTNQFMIEDWKNNSNNYINNMDNKIEKSMLYFIYDNDDINTLDCFNNNGYISTISNHSLIDESSLNDILEFGLSIVICPQIDNYDIINNIQWSDKHVKDIKKVIYNFIRREKNRKDIHYIHDDYYDIGFLPKNMIEG